VAFGPDHSSAKPLSVREAQRRLRSSGDAERARFLLRFFKTGPGEYGEHDRFLGLTVPAIRHVAHLCRAWTLVDVRRMLRSPWHEERLLALVVLVDLAERSDRRARADMVRFYLQSTRYVNNWDLVDASAPSILGPYVAAGNRRLLARLARSPLVWERRMALLAAGYLIRQDEFEPILRVAKSLLEDEHDLIHKAAGWMLREVGKRDRSALLGFLDRHAAQMPRTMLRYAIERLPAQMKRRYMDR